MTLAAAAACESPPVERPALAVEFDPAPGSRAVPTTVAPSATFEVPLDPAVVGPELLRLRSGDLWPSGRVRYGVVDRRVAFVPSVPLRSNLAYRIVLDPAIRGIDGSRPAHPPEAVFVTGTTAHDPPREPSTPVWESDVAPLLEWRCGGCHAGPRPAANLKLAPSFSAIRALGGRSAEWLGWLLAAPGAPERSYILYKIVGAPGIVGDRMPPDSPLPVEDARTVERWIAAGGAEDGGWSD